MPKRNAEQKAARELQRTEGIGYQQAIRRVRDETAATPPTEPKPPAVAYVLHPTAAEATDGITAEELGVRALPADATPTQRAHAEAVWRPAGIDRPCRCSGGCDHAAPCPDRDQGCTGRLTHVDRHPGSLFVETAWWDTYQCTECDEVLECGVTLPELPWGEQREAGGILIFSGVRHPNFPEIHEDTPELPDGDGSCRSCGGYAIAGLLCDGCRADGWSDAYGILEEPDPDDGPECECGGILGDPGHDYHCVC
ncbi:hypothetical protein G5C51_04580 [Streptomyces sp. A7024]|uniref:Uncharacterized protein n=1 Tax=Streptomyces coryli TaxID=1128680 RepID=A0A6G4TTI6_9ACTN|nr:hypothetical protein [Streptomyces coryli]NGN63184.1 hypothetical protein [Streptomyces coryli]